MELESFSFSIEITPDSLGEREIPQPQPNLKSNLQNPKAGDEGSLVET